MVEIGKIARIKRPTSAQLDYARFLMAELGYDEDDYDIENMTRSRLANFIDDLRYERGDCTAG